MRSPHPPAPGGSGESSPSPQPGAGPAAREGRSLGAGGATAASRAPRRSSRTAESRGGPGRSRPPSAPGPAASAAPVTWERTWRGTEYLKMEFRIKHTWDGLPVSHEPVTVVLRPDNAGLLMEVRAPFFNDPPAPPGEPGKPFGGLWDYEVVEAFFLSARTEQYLEVELCPHGQYLLLLLSGRRKVWKEGLPLEFEVTRMKTQWEGKALLPWSYFPPCTDKFNAFAIHGSGEERKYEALYPVPPHQLQEGQEPDFHRLEFFQDLNLKELTGEDWKQPESDTWKSLTK